jgi:hypothetical protein
VAVAVLCLAVAWLGGLLGQAELEHTNQMSYQELREYVRDGAIASFAERYLVSFLLSAVFVGLVELLAAGFRAAVPAPRGLVLTGPSYR